MGSSGAASADDRSPGVTSNWPCPNGAPVTPQAEAPTLGTGKTPFVLGHRSALDGLRAVAILLVLAVHTTYLLVPEYQGRFIPGGFIGVDIFFVLSGFLITSLLLEEWGRRRVISMKNFYRRRALRLFPALWVMLAVQFGYTLVEHDPGKADLKGLAAIFFYVSNWSWKFGALTPANLGQTWSLAVEEQFYLLWPIVLLALLRSRHRRLLPWAMGCLIAVAFFSRIALWHARVPWTEIMVQTETRLDALILGALLAYALQRGWRPPPSVQAAGWLGAGVIAAVALTSHRESAWLFDGGYTLVALAAALVICAALDDRRPLGRMLSLPPLQTLGRLSYSLYLWHFLVFTAVERAGHARPPSQRLVAGWGMTAVLSVASYRFVEQPFLRRKGLHSAGRNSAGRNSAGRSPDRRAATPAPSTPHQPAR